MVRLELTMFVFHFTKVVPSPLGHIGVTPKVGYDPTTCELTARRYYLLSYLGIIIIIVNFKFFNFEEI